MVPTDELRDDYPVFEWQAMDARFLGGEFAASLNESTVENCTAQLSWSWVDAQNSEGESLPLIPPMSTRATVGYRLGSWRTSAVFQHSMDANLVHCAFGGTIADQLELTVSCLLYTSPSPRD